MLNREGYCEDEKEFHEKFRKEADTFAPPGKLLREFARPTGEAFVVSKEMP